MPPLKEFDIVLKQATILANQIGSEKLVIALGVGVLFLVVFIAVFLSGQPEKSMGQKLFDLVAMFFYTIAFVGFIIGGMYVGEMIGSMPGGFCIGVIAFAIIFNTYGYAKMRRQKKLYRR